MIFRESSKGTVKSINMSKSSIEESTVYQYITLPVSGNYTVTAHDIVDGTIITNPSVVYPQVLEYILLLSSPTETVSNICKYYTHYYITCYNYVNIVVLLSSKEGYSLPIDVTTTADSINVSSTISMVTSVEPTRGIQGSISSQCEHDIIHVDSIFIYSYSWSYSFWNCYNIISSDICDNSNIMLLL